MNMLVESGIPIMAEEIRRGSLRFQALARDLCHLPPGFLERGVGLVSYPVSETTTGAEVSIGGGELPEEIQRSVAKRRVAYVTGRICAESALAQLGMNCGVPRGQHGELVWPQAIAGAITHNDTIAVPRQSELISA